MSKKPTIRIVYPEASGVAMKLTEAMIRRTPGKRTVETVAEDRHDGDDAGYLLADLDAVKTSTSVELTLTLCPSAMDYALTQLIAKNLTEDEKKSIFDGMTGWELLQQATIMAVGANPDGSVPEENAKQEAPSFSYQTYAEIGLILAALEFIPYNNKKTSSINFLKDLTEITKRHLKRNRDEWEGDFVLAKEHADIMLHDTPPTAADPEKMITDLTGILYNNDHDIKKQEPSWDDVEKEAQSLGKENKTDE